MNNEWYTPDDVIGGRAGWCVAHGDCLSLLPQIAEVHHVITDPPYSRHVHYNGRRGTNPGGSGETGGWMTGICEATDLGFDEMTDATRSAVSAHLARVVSRWSLVFCDVESVASWIVALAPLKYMRTCVWHKVCAPPQFSGDRPAQAFECVVCAHGSAKRKWNGGGQQGFYSALVVNPGRGDEKRTHTTQKPLALMLDLVRDFTDPDDVVLDPFCGSGTTGEACLRLGRRFIGIEMQQKYADVARKRLTDVDEELRAYRGERVAVTKPRQVGLFK